jgi:agmatinase
MDSAQLTDSQSFMGFQYPLESSKVVVLQAPYEKTSTYSKGQALGPNMIIEASNQVETYDIELKKDFVDSIGFHTLPPMNIEELSAEDMTNTVMAETAKVLEQKKFPLLFGGEHSVSIGAIKACFTYFKNLTVVHIDAHADMRDEYQGSRFNHACVMARTRELMPAVSIGIRSMCKDEAELIDEKYSDLIFDSRLDASRIEQIHSKIQTKNIYLTIDIDGFDPSIMPATGTPEPGGLVWEDTLQLIKRLARDKTIVGMDINELAPISGQVASDFNCAKLAYKVCGYIFEQ